MRKQILVMSSVLLQLPDPEPYLAMMRKAGYEVIADKQFLERAPEEVIREYLPESCAFLSGGYSIPVDVLEASSQLRVISHLCSGYEKLDLDALNRKGIVATNTPIPEMAYPVADLAIGMMFALAREIPKYDRYMKESRYERGWGRMVSGQTLGVVGMGQIGRETIKRARGLNMKVLVWNRTRDLAFEKEWDVCHVELNQLLTEADYVSLHLRYHPETAGIIGEKQLNLMKSTSYIINTARLKLIDQHALLKCLFEGRIAGAALDFGGEDDLVSGLIQLDNVIVTPHIGNRVQQSAIHTVECGIRNALAVLEGGIPEFVINPETLKLRQ